MDRKVTDNDTKVTDKGVHPEFGQYYRCQPGDEVIAWTIDRDTDKIIKTVIGVVFDWQLFDRSWGCTIKQEDGQDFFPSNITCLRPLTKLDKALK